MCSSSPYLKQAVQIVAFISLLIGIGISGLSSWILHKSLQMKKNHEINGKEILNQANTFFGGLSGGQNLYDYDIIFRILITNAATALTAGALQLLFSLALFLGTIKGGSFGRFIGKVWVYVHVAIMLTIGSATLCILTNELQLNGPIMIFLISTGVDAFLIIFFMWLVYTWAFQEMEDEDTDSRVKSRHGVNVYHNPPGYTTTAPARNGQVMENFKDVKLRPVSVV